MVLLPRSAFQAVLPTLTALFSVFFCSGAGSLLISWPTYWTFRIGIVRHCISWWIRPDLNRRPLPCNPNELGGSMLPYTLHRQTHIFGAPRRIQTHNLRVRSAMLYSVELEKQIWCPRPGFEPATYRLQGDCSTTELQGQNFCGSPYIETLLTPQGDQVGKL